MTSTCLVGDMRFGSCCIF